MQCECDTYVYGYRGMRKKLNPARGDAGYCKNKKESSVP